LHEQRKKQHDWLTTSTDNVTSQSHLLFASFKKNAYGKLALRRFSSRQNFPHTVMFFFVSRSLFLPETLPDKEECCSSWKFGLAENRLY
jgi:hypothetical protein